MIIMTLFGQLRDKSKLVSSIALAGLGPIYISFHLIICQLCTLQYVMGKSIEFSIHLKMVSGDLYRIIVMRNT